MKKTPAQIITQVGPKGQLPLNVTQQLMRLLSAHGGKRIKLTIAEVKRTRSLNQNAYYWGVVVPAVHALFTEAGNECDQDEVHEYLKLHVGKLRKVVVEPSGVRNSTAASTAKLSTLEFEDYLERIRAWAAQYGAVVPLPNEELETA